MSFWGKCGMFSVDMLIFHISLELFSSPPQTRLCSYHTRPVGGSITPPSSGDAPSDSTGPIFSCDAAHPGAPEVGRHGRCQFTRLRAGGNSLRVLKLPCSCRNHRINTSKGGGRVFVQPGCYSAGDAEKSSHSTK